MDVGYIALICMLGLTKCDIDTAQIRDNYAIMSLCPEGMENVVNPMENYVTFTDGEGNILHIFVRCGKEA